MIKMIGKATGVTMLVADDKVDKFLAAGYKLADQVTEKPAEVKPKRTRKKTAKE